MRKLLLISNLLYAFSMTQAASAASAAIDGVIYDVQQNPAIKTTLLLRDNHGTVVARTITDEAGHYSFDKIGNGSYELSAIDQDKILGSAIVTITGDAQMHKDLLLQSVEPMNVVVGRAYNPRTVRNTVSPASGTSAYTIDKTAIEAIPTGADTSFDKVLEQSPGVAQDSFGQTHIRGEHANLQYRLNGILLPEGISGFGQAIDSRIIERATLLDGALPAQYGFRTAAIVDIQTKTGIDPGGEISFRGGSHGTLQPSLSYEGSKGQLDYFFTASHLSSDLGIEAPTSSPNVIHDHTDQDKQFAYASYALDPYQKISILAGNSLGYFQIPNIADQTPVNTVSGVNTFNSSQLNERQSESNQYATLVWQASREALDLQAAPYIRSSNIHFKPDNSGDLIYGGVASDVQRNSLATGLQADGTWRANPSHTVRAGLLIQNEHVDNKNSSLVFPADADGNQTATTPFTVIDNNRKDGQFYGLYVQDEWRLTNALTVNGGLRFDAVEAYTKENQISPRLGLLYKLDPATDLHAGYANYFTPPPLELISPTSVQKFDGTTNQAASASNDAVKSERSHVLDVGAVQRFDSAWQTGIDSYYKFAQNLLDEGQFGNALVYTPFNYRYGHIYGVELTASYTTEKLKAYTNFSYSRALGKQITSGQFNFSQDELDYINSHNVHLDHDQTYTGSAGISYKITRSTVANLDGILGSGLRKSFANTQHLPWYTQFDAAINHELDLVPKNPTTVGLSVINLFNTAYELRDGSGIGVGAPQWGPRRGVFATVTQRF